MIDDWEEEQEMISQMTSDDVSVAEQLHSSAGVNVHPLVFFSSCSGLN